MLSSKGGAQGAVASGSYMRIFVTGGAGFVGSSLARMLVAERGASVLVVDDLRATSSLASLASIAQSPRYQFRKADVCDRERITALLHAFAPDAVVHAAFDASAPPARGDETCLQTNVLGTWRILEATRDYWATLPATRQDKLRFLSVSSDGAISPAGAGRSGADDLVSAWHKSYGLPTIVSKAAANFGPFQFPRHAVPAAVIAGIAGEAATMEVAEPAGWLYIEDHVRALVAMLEKGTPGATYHVAGKGFLRTSELHRYVGQLLERHAPRPAPAQAMAATFAAEASGALVEDAPPVSTRLAEDTAWRAQETAETALAKTVRWYLTNEPWWRPLHAAAAGGDHWGLLRIA